VEPAEEKVEEEVRGRKRTGRKKRGDRSKTASGDLDEN